MKFYNEIAVYYTKGHFGENRGHFGGTEASLGEKKRATFGETGHFGGTKATLGETEPTLGKAATFC